MAAKSCQSKLLMFSKLSHQRLRHWAKGCNDAVAKAVSRPLSVVHTSEHSKEIVSVLRLNMLADNPGAMKKVSPIVQLDALAPGWDLINFWIVHRNVVWVEE